MKKLLILFMFCIVLCGCNSKDNSKGIELNEVMSENEYIIVDVRTEKEFEEEHIVGAINIPLVEIDKEVELDKEKVILVYCFSGGRSKDAHDKLKSLGLNMLQLSSVLYFLGEFSEIELPKE